MNKTEEFCAVRGSFCLPGFLEARVHVQVCLLWILSREGGAAICIRSSWERGPALCPAGYLFRSLLGLYKAAVPAKQAQDNLKIRSFYVLIAAV